jgi:hypothetical protein
MESPEHPKKAEKNVEEEPKLFGSDIDDELASVREEIKRFEEEMTELEATISIRKKEYNSAEGKEKDRLSPELLRLMEELTATEGMLFRAEKDLRQLLNVKERLDGKDKSN